VDITKAGLFIVGFLPTIQASKRELKNTIFHYCILLDAVGNLVLNIVFKKINTFDFMAIKVII
jgi:hypothetical protein